VIHPDIANIAENMREFGLSILGKAVCEAICTMPRRPYAQALLVPLAAQAAEIIVKARIAEEHPLLIFESLPKPTPNLLDLKGLFEHGQTIQCKELAKILWATTGCEIKKVNEFLEFGNYAT